MRFNMKMFFVLLTLVALLIGSLIYPSRAMMVITAGLVWASLVVGAIAAVISGARRRPFCAGYAIAGLTFFALAQMENPSTKEARQALFERVILPLHLKLPNSSATRRDLTQTEGTVRLSMGVLLGCLGGSVAMILRARDKRSS
jgi:hypothetical protein